MKAYVVYKKGFPVAVVKYLRDCAPILGVAEDSVSSYAVPSLREKSPNGTYVVKVEVDDE